MAAAAVVAAAPSAVAHVLPAVQASSAAVIRGQHIFAYSNIRTNQIVYSLTRSMNNNDSLRQLPFLGKKTVPAKIRKDLWTPYCVLSFPTAFQGLSALQKLREFRRLHETSYPLDLVADRDSNQTDKLLTKKKKGKVLMDQKANSVADMAAVLLLQQRPPSPEQVRRAKMMTSRPVIKTKAGDWFYGSKAKRGPGSKTMAAALDFQGSVKGVEIRWANPLDAEYAETWPVDVVHGPLQQNRYTAVWPPASDFVDDEATAEKKVPSVEGVEGEKAVETGEVTGPEVRSTEGKGILIAADVEKGGGRAGL